jgi:hypothetical protein
VLIWNFEDDNSMIDVSSCWRDRRHDSKSCWSNAQFNMISEEI